ncbi:hypothetical protein RUND412_004867 [Rhizina undulata]
MEHIIAFYPSVPRTLPAPKSQGKSKSQEQGKPPATTAPSCFDDGSSGTPEIHDDITEFFCDILGKKQGDGLPNENGSLEEQGGVFYVQSEPTTTVLKSHGPREKREMRAAKKKAKAKEVDRVRKNRETTRRKNYPTPPPISVTLPTALSADMTRMQGELADVQAYPLTPYPTAMLPPTGYQPLPMSLPTISEEDWAFLMPQNFLSPHPAPSPPATLQPLSPLPSPSPTVTTPNDEFCGTYYNAPPMHYLQAPVHLQTPQTNPEWHDTPTIESGEKGWPGYIEYDTGNPFDPDLDFNINLDLDLNLDISMEQQALTGGEELSSFDFCAGLDVSGMMTPGEQQYWGLDAGFCGNQVFDVPADGWCANVLGQEGMHPPPPITAG